MTPDRHALGLDIGGTRISAAVVSHRGEAKALAREATPRQEGAHVVLDRVTRLAEAVILQSEGLELEGIGIGFGGPVDHHAGRIRTSHHVFGWADIDVLAALSERFGLPCYLENDANAGGLGEALFGAAQGRASLLYVNIGTGVGGAIVIEGRIHRGANSNAGELGHVVLDPHGPPCTCGKRGCVEALCSGDAIGAMARNADLSGSALAKLPTEDLSGREVGKRAAAGDSIAREIIGRSASFMGLALAGAANLLDPEVIVLGGGVSQLGPVYLEPCREAFRAHAMHIPAQHTKILPAQLGYDAGVIGAAAVALTKQQAPSISPG